MSLLDFLLFASIYNSSKVQNREGPPDDYYWGLNDEFSELEDEEFEDDFGDDSDSKYF
ncbi:MAG: hypothetical protein J6T10_27870 [Methanobrevibacter sp.]|nr:hypothetical protein [Methanobrevibacter sp.]